MEIAQSTLVMGQISARVAFDSGFTPVIDNYLPDDMASADTNGALTPQQHSARHLSAQQDSVSTAYANVTDLKVAITRAGSYAFQYWLPYFASDATEGIGLQLRFSGTADVASLYSIECWTAQNVPPASLVIGNFTDAVAPFATGPAFPSPAIVKIYGSLLATTVGDLNLQLRAETGGANSVTLMKQGWCQVWAT